MRLRRLSAGAALLALLLCAGAPTAPAPLGRAASPRPAILSWITLPPLAAPALGDPQAPEADSVIALPPDTTVAVIDSAQADSLRAPRDSSGVAVDAGGLAAPRDASNLMPTSSQTEPPVEQKAAGEEAAGEEAAGEEAAGEEAAVAAAAAEAAGDSLDLSFLEEPPERDLFGFLARWRAASADTNRIRPYRYAPEVLPSNDPLLLRMTRRLRARGFVREELQLRPDYFRSSDSLVVTLDARADSLVQEGGTAAGTRYLPSRSGGLRWIVPSALPALSTRSPVVAEHAADLDGARITRALVWRGSDVQRRVAEPYAAYLSRLTRVQARRVWKGEIDRVRRETTVTGGRAGLVRIALPFDLPPAIKSVLGEGTPNLSVSGSERISFGGRSQWFPHRPTTEYQRKPSKFPQLEMEQDLAIQLKGTVGDKLDVDVDQASQAATPLANKIKIHYHGYEDEIIRRVDLGNTSLNLPGTEYVSYGGRHTGLFGINAEAQLGDVTLNMVVSKEEGETAEKSTSTRSEEQIKRIYDYEYIRDRFFFLDDPEVDAYPEDPLSYVVDIDPTSVELWLDDGDGPTQENFAMTPGIAALNLRDSRVPPGNPDTTETLYFERLELNTDYVLYIDERFENERLEVHPYIVLYRYLDERSTLAVTYLDRGLGRQIGGISNGRLHAKMIRPKDELVAADMTSGTWGPTRGLMLRNVYSLHPSAASWAEEGLPEASVLSDGFEMSIHYKGTVGDSDDPDVLDGVKVIRYLGLDYYQETDTGYQLGQDGKVDFGRWIDQARGLIYFPDVEPFATASQPELRGRPGTPDSWDLLPTAYRNPGIYERKTCVRRRQSPGSDTTWTSRFYIEVKYRTPVTELRIDAWDIIEGSEVVTIGSRRLAKDRDYRIDYQTGVIQLYDDAAVGESDEIRVTYKYGGSFGTVSKTLLGAAMRYAPEDGRLALSSSWLYARSGSPDRRPRLGSEPTRIAVGEVAASYASESMFLTRLLDRLPMLDTRRPSQIAVEGGLGVSFPNPNTRNDLYIDDFEGVADDILVQLNRLSWKAASIPVSAPGADEAGRAARRGEIWWYTPYRALREGDLNPTLDYQEANDYRSVLELQMWPYGGPLAPEGGELCPPESSWVGLTQNLARTSLDLTRARFLDIWVNDFVPWETYAADTTTRGGVMYVELGRVSEDALWQRRPIDCAGVAILGGPLDPPNRALDSEDRNNDEQLDLSDENDEDTGLDGVSEDDGGGDYADDYGFSGDPETTYGADPDLCEVYAQINGTEGNARLDTEDLDGDNSLSQLSSYFQFRVDLADTSVVETDVARDYPSSDWSPSGWRRLRIPLSDAYVNRFVNDPSWEDVKQIRIWFTGLRPPATGPWPGRKRLQIGSLEIRSNRWVAEALRDTSGALVPPEEIVAAEEDFFPGVYNNKENADVYVAPFREHRDRSVDNAKEREQSLTLEVRNFQPGHVGRVYTPFLREQDYSGYEFLEFWLNSTLATESQAEFFIRLCKEVTADSTHFYEYRAAVPTITDPADRRGSWLPVKIRLSDFSDLKRAGLPDSVAIERELPDGGVIRMEGRPYLTKIGRITLGVVNVGGQPIENANVWVDELRLTHVLKEVDTAYRLQLRTEFSDVAKLDIGFKRLGADFGSISGGGFRARKEEETSLSTSGSVALDRFTPLGLGLRLPLSVQTTWTRRVPKYRTNDDLLVEKRSDSRDVTETASQNYSLSISREKARSGILKYTLDSFSLSGSYRKSESATPFARDTTLTRSLSVGYTAPLGSGGEWRFYRDMKLRLLPTDLSASLSRGWQEDMRWRRRDADLNQPYELDDRRAVRSGGLNLKAGLRPIQAITYSFSQSRDLMLRQRAAWLGGLNLGSELSRQEDVGTNYNLRLLSGWIEPRLSWRGSFRGNFNQQENVGGGELERVNNLTNSRSASVSGDLPLARVLQLLGRVGRRGAGDGATAEDEKEPRDPDALDDEEERAAGRTSRTTAAGNTDGAASGGPLSRLLEVSRTTGSLSHSQQTTFNRVHGEPSLAYQLGLSLNPEVARLSSSRETRTNSHTVKLDTDLRILRSVGLGASFEQSEAKTQANGTETGKIDRVWPDLDFRWGDLTNRLRLRRFVKSMKTSSHYTHRRSENSQGGTATRRESSGNWSPLIDLGVTLQSGVSFTLRVDQNSSRSQDFSGIGRTTERSETRFKLSGKKSLDITREVTVPLTQTKQRIKSRLDLSLEVKFDRNKHTSRQGSEKPQLMGDQRKFDFALNGTYGFSKSVSGRAEINFGENADNKNKTHTSRYVGVSVSAGFSF